MLADLTSRTVADVLLLIAAVVFGLSALLPLRARPLQVETILIPLGLCLVATALWLVI